MNGSMGAECDTDALLAAHNFGMNQMAMHMYQAFADQYSVFRARHFPPAETRYSHITGVGPDYPQELH